MLTQISITSKDINAHNLGQRKFIDFCKLLNARAALLFNNNNNNNNKSIYFHICKGGVTLQNIA